MYVSTKAGNPRKFKRLIAHKLNEALFTQPTGIRYIKSVVAKSTNVPENTNINTLANNSAPNNSAFFVCRPRSPKEKAARLILSMVTCSGKVRPCYDPVFVVFQTAIRYRQSLKRKAITFNNSIYHTGATQ